MPVIKLEKAFDLIKAGLNILDEIDCNEERSRSMKNDIKKAISYYEEILR